MFLFIGGIVLLVVGYFTYGRFIEKILAPDDRDPPSKRLHDGVDYLCLPHWKNVLIQLLNIAGVGPIIGVILGVKFGSIVFIIIPIGNIIAGATHDFLAGMMSLRNDGANIPALIRKTLGNGYYRFFGFFVCLLLLLVVAVFINIPAQIIDGTIPQYPVFWAAVVVIFIYYICATLLPIDQIIGRIYPFLGAFLLLGTLAIAGAVVWRGFQDPSLLVESAAFKERMFTAQNNYPIIPMLFVTIACGIISGFHATQAPLVVRTMHSERKARPVFYGTMITEGVIAMIWAAAGLMIYNLFPESMAKTPSTVLGEITCYFLNEWMGTITILGVALLAITSGDTAMRSLRLSLVEMVGLSQKSFKNRMLLCLPIIAAVAGLLFWSNRDADSFTQLWNYFAWGNQVIAASTLLAGSAWLLSLRKPYWVALAPGLFMSFIVLTYILWISPEHGGPVGIGLPLHTAYAIAGVGCVVAAFWTLHRGRRLRALGRV